MDNQVFTLEELYNMTERSMLFLLVKGEMKRRGHWKNKNRGSKPSCDFTRVSIQPVESQQVKQYLPYKDDEFSDGI